MRAYLKHTGSQDKPACLHLTFFSTPQCVVIKISSPQQEEVTKPAGGGTHFLISLPPRWLTPRDSCFSHTQSHAHFHIADGFVLPPVPWLLL